MAETPRFTKEELRLIRVALQDNHHWQLTP